MEKIDIYFFENQRFNYGVQQNIDEYTTRTFYEYDKFYRVEEQSALCIMVLLDKYYYIDTLTLFQLGYRLSKGGGKVGVWRKYNKQGELIDEIDYDKDWKIKTDDLVPIFKNHAIDYGSIERIDRYVEDSNDGVYYCWLIEVEDSPYEKHYYVFDGQTGEKIDESIEIREEIQ